MIELQTQRRQEYERTILIPLREAVEKAGGRIALAKKMKVKPSELQAILHKTNDMRISTLMKLCSALNIALVFIDMNAGYKLVQSPTEEMHQFCDTIKFSEACAQYEKDQKDKQKIEPCVVPEMPEFRKKFYKDQLELMKACSGINDEMLASEKDKK